MTEVLYVNHTSVLGGGERSLLELIAALPDGISPTLACPDGALADGAGELGVPTLRIEGFTDGFGIDPLQMPAAFLRFARAASSLRRVLALARPRLVHANSVRAGLATIVAAGRGGPPVLVHVRDCLPPGPASRLVRGHVCARSALVLANSRYTARSFVGDLEIEARVVHPSIDLSRFDPAQLSREEARTRLGLVGEEPTLGVVGQLTAWKGQLEAIQTLGILQARVPDARLLIVGSVKFASARFDNRGYERALRREAEQLGVAHAVSFLGELGDVREVLRALDLLLVPSWEEPFGRAVLEGMAMQLPVLATSVGGPAEIIEDGIDGLLLPPRDPGRWADAAENLLASPERRAALGRAARRKALAGFGLQAPAEAARAAYESVLGERLGRQVRPPLVHAEGSVL